MGAGGSEVEAAMGCALRSACDGSARATLVSSLLMAWPPRRLLGSLLPGADPGSFLSLLGDQLHDVILQALAVTLDREGSQCLEDFPMDLGREDLPYLTNALVVACRTLAHGAPVPSQDGNTVVVVSFPCRDTWLETVNECLDHQGLIMVPGTVPGPSYLLVSPTTDLNSLLGVCGRPARERFGLALAYAGGDMPRFRSCHMRRSAAWAMMSQVREELEAIPYGTLFRDIHGWPVRWEAVGRDPGTILSAFPEAVMAHATATGFHDGERT